MFNNIGKKIKTLAKILCWVGIVCSVLTGIAIIVSGGNATLAVNNGYSPLTMESSYTTVPSAVIGIVVIILGSLAAWIGSFFAYGFGQLIENSDQIRENTSKQ